MLLPERTATATGPGEPPGRNRTGALIENVGTGVGDAVNGVLRGIGLVPGRGGEDATR